MAITKRAPRGPKLPRPAKARDILMARVSCSVPLAKKGPILGKSAQAHNSENLVDTKSESESSVSPSHAHPSRIIPCRNQFIPDSSGHLSPIQILSLESPDKSSELPSSAVGLNDAIESSLVQPPQSVPHRIPPSSPTCVEETPPVLGQSENACVCPFPNLQTSAEHIPLSSNFQVPEHIHLGPVVMSQEQFPPLGVPPPASLSQAQAFKNSLSGWSDVLKRNNNQSFLLRYIPPSWEDGCPVAAPSSEVFELGGLHWKHTLVGKVIGEPPSFHAFKLFASKVWKDFGPVSVSTAEDGIALFKFLDDVTCSKVLQRPWHFNHKPFILRKWIPGCNLSELFSDSVEVWVKFFGVPIELITGEGLSHVVSLIGNPIQLDAQAIYNGKLNAINALVRLDISKPRQSQVKVKLLNGNYVVVNVSYQDQPIICNLCKRSGHISANCRAGSNRTRGRSFSKGPPRRLRSSSKSGPKNRVKTHAVWVEKQKVVENHVVKDPLPNIQISHDNGNADDDQCDRITEADGEQYDRIGETIAEGYSDKSEHDLDQLEWTEVQPKKKKNSKKKKKAVVPQPSSTLRVVPKGREIVSENPRPEMKKKTTKGGSNTGIVINDEVPKATDATLISASESSFGNTTHFERGEPSKVMSKSLPLETTPEEKSQREKRKNAQEGASLPVLAIHTESRNKEGVNFCHPLTTDLVQAGCLVQERGLNPTCT